VIQEERLTNSFPIPGAEGTFSPMLEVYSTLAVFARVRMYLAKVDVKPMSFEYTPVESDFDEFCILTVNKDAEY
jgi:hypothetical protein